MQPVSKLYKVEGPKRKPPPSETSPPSTNRISARLDSTDDLDFTDDAVRHTAIAMREFCGIEQLAIAARVQ